MKVSKLMLVILALVTMLAFACKQKAEEAPADTMMVETEEVQMDPIDQWSADVKVVVEKWEAKTATAKLTMAEIEEFAAETKPLMERAASLDLEAKATEAQAAIIKDLNARMDALKKM